MQPKKPPTMPTHPLSQDNIVLQIGVYLGFIPLALLTALIVRVFFLNGDPNQLYFVPFTALLPFVVQMVGSFLSAKQGKQVSKTAGRMIITTVLFVAFAVLLLIRWVF